MPVEKSIFLASNWSFLLPSNAHIIFLASNWLFSLPSWGQICGCQISCLELVIFIAGVRPDMWIPSQTQNISELFFWRRLRNQDFWPRTGNFYCRLEVRQIFCPRNRLFFCHWKAWNIDVTKIGYFYCRRNARYLDVRCISSNRPFSLRLWGELYEHYISFPRIGLFHCQCEARDERLDWCSSYNLSVSVLIKSVSICASNPIKVW